MKQSYPTKETIRFLYVESFKYENQNQVGLVHIYPKQNTKFFWDVLKEIKQKLKNHSKDDL